jgi:general secretion pathway protein G
MHPSSPSVRAGFSLVELLVVIAIMAILAGVVAVNVMHVPGEAKVDAAKLELKQLQTAVQVYRTEQGQVPTLQQGLLALVERPTVPPIPERYPADGYIDGMDVPTDPWGNTYIYLVPGRTGKSFEIISYGSDGEPGGDGDAADLSSNDLGS